MSCEPGRSIGRLIFYGRFYGLTSATRDFSWGNHKASMGIGDVGNRDVFTRPPDPFLHRDGTSNGI